MGSIHRPADYHAVPTGDHVTKRKVLVRKCGPQIRHQSLIRRDARLFRHAMERDILAEQLQHQFRLVLVEYLFVKPAHDLRICPLRIRRHELPPVLNIEYSFIYLILQYPVNVRAKKKRNYQSSIRQQQADETRARIVAAAHKLLEEHGYAGMTMEAIAQQARVAAATIYAIFGSKTGILLEILNAARFGDNYHDLIREALQTSDPRERIQYPARIARRIYESEHAVLDLLRGAGAVAPVFAQKESEGECMRYEAQKGMIQYLVDSDSLRPGLDQKRARDILWSLTSRDMYRMLVRDQGWTGKEYEDWLAKLLVDTLVGPRAKASQSPQPRRAQQSRTPRDPRRGA